MLLFSDYKGKNSITILMEINDSVQGMVVYFY